MDLNALKSDLELLARIVGGWSAGRDIAPIERDLVLEKLRRLYETVYSGAAEETPAPVAPLSEAAAAGRIGETETIDLGAVLSLDALPDTPEPESKPESKPEPETEPSAPVMPVPAGEASALAENGAAPAEEVRIPAAAAPAETADVPATEISDPVGEESVPAGAEVAPVLGPAAGPAGTFPAAASAGEPEPASDGAAGAPKTDEEPSPDSRAVPTLFGPEEATRRHRHKQRLIMSLYDAAPETAAPGGGDADASSARRRELPENPAPHAAVRPEPSESLRPQRETSAAAISGAEEPAVSPEPEMHPFRPQGGAVLGEVIGHDRRTLADTIAAPRDMASELLRNEPVGDLHHAIGINDRFLMIRDLFGGDAGAFDRAVDALNGCPSLDDCMILIAENYAWNPNSDGAQLMMELLERKFA